MGIMNGTEFSGDWAPTTGTATFGEIVGATWDSYIYLSNVDARANAEELYIRHVSERLQSYGINIAAPDLGLPGRENDPAARSAALGVSVMGGGIGAVATTTALVRDQSEEIAAWLAQVTTAMAARPDVIEAMGGMPDIDAGTRRVMAEAEERLSAYSATRSGAISLAAQFVGGVPGTLADPVQGPLAVATAAYGGAGVYATATRSVWLAIGRMALREAAVNAASEAVAQPFVQANRKYAGLDYGFGQALTEIGWAAVIGGGLGGVIEGATQGLRRVVSGPTTTPGKAPPPPSVIRGAVNAMEADLALTTARPAGVSVAAHTAALDAGARAAADPSQMRQAADGIRLATDDGGGILETGATRVADDGTEVSFDALTLGDGQRYVRDAGTTDWRQDAPDTTARNTADALDADARMGAPDNEPDNAPRATPDTVAARTAAAPDETLRAMPDEELAAFREKVAKQAETRPETAEQWKTGYDARRRLQQVDAEIARRAEGAEPRRGIDYPNFVDPARVGDTRGDGIIGFESGRLRLLDGSEVTAQQGASTLWTGAGNMIDPAVVVAFKNSMPGANWVPTAAGKAARKGGARTKPGTRQTLAPGEATGFLNSRAATIDEHRARAAAPRPELDRISDGLGEMPPFEEAEMAAQLADLESLFPDVEAIEMPDGSRLSDHLAEADRGRRMAAIVSACGLG